MSAQVAADGTVMFSFDDLLQELKQVAEQRLQKQVQWLLSRGFTSELILDAAKEWKEGHPTSIPTDSEILDLCEKIVRRSTTKLRLIASNA